MRVVMVVAVLCAVPALVDADPAKAKAANTRGYTLHKKKKYKEAAVEYRNAITEDPSMLLAHYNLACVASLTKDEDTALKELAWVSDRASWDTAARSAAAKARTDKDLTWIRDAQPDGMRLTGTDLPDEGAIDLMGRPEPALVGKASSDAKLVKAVAAAPGKHEDKCSAAAFSAPLDSKNTATVAVNLRDGVAVLDPSGKVLARSEALGCTGAQDQVTVMTQVAGIATGYTHTDKALMETRFIAVQYAAGGKQNVAIFAFKDKKELVRVFDGVMKTEAAAGSLIQTPLLGNLVYAAPGEKKKRVFRWDSASWKFVPEVK